MNKSNELTIVGTDLVDLNRKVARWLGLDPSYTISTNIGQEIARVTGLSFETSKMLFHAGVAGFVGTVASGFGVLPAAVVIGAILMFAWLESFDSSKAIW